MFGALMGLGIGRLFDLGHHKWSTAIGMCAAGVYVLSAAMGYSQPVTAVVALAMGALIGPLYASAYNFRVTIFQKPPAILCAFKFGAKVAGIWAVL